MKLDKVALSVSSARLAGAIAMLFSLDEESTLWLWIIIVLFINAN